MNQTFVVNVPVDGTKEQWDAFQKFMDEVHDATHAEIKQIASEMNVTEQCASDIWYLRTRSRWTTELETELIRFHKIGQPPNVFEFGNV